MARLSALKLKGTAKARGEGFPYFPPLHPPVRIVLRKWKEPPLGFPLTEHQTEQRGGCTLVKLCK